MASNGTAIQTFGISAFRKNHIARFARKRILAQWEAICGRFGKPNPVIPVMSRKTDVISPWISHPLTFPEKTNLEIP
jgi:hypothetical protein